VTVIRDSVLPPQIYTLYDQFEEQDVKALEKMTKKKTKLRKDKNTFKNMNAIFIRELFYDENHSHSYDNNNHRGSNQVFWPRAGYKVCVAALHQYNSLC
jgi:hypothetical protein